MTDPLCGKAIRGGDSSHRGQVMLILRHWLIEKTPRAVHIRRRQICKKLNRSLNVREIGEVCVIIIIISMGECKREVTPVRMHWSYFFLHAATDLQWFCSSLVQGSRRIFWARQHSEHSHSHTTIHKLAIIQSTGGSPRKAVGEPRPRCRLHTVPLSNTQASRLFFEGIVQN